MYAAEIANLRSNSSIPVTLVKQLCLVLDADGFFRCVGRSHNSHLAESAKFRHLLPPNHPSKFLNKFNSIACKETFLRCVTCRKVQGTAFRPPDPAPLPKLRVQEAVPFLVAGVDFTGPLHVRSENGIIQSYICLFTCAVTRAVHLEVVSEIWRKFSAIPPTILKSQISTTSHDIR